MAHYKSIVAYDGTEFFGFQRQAGERTVQSVLEQALTALGWTHSSLLAAGRTDRGVHAEGQVVGYALNWRHETGRLTEALNAHLPQDVAIRDTAMVEPGFHPRYAARWRTYAYWIVFGEHRDPLRERYAWRVWPEPDLRRMRLAAAQLIGEHDFGAFGRAPDQSGHTVRVMRRVEVSSEDGGLRVRFEANAFLYRMVRRMVGALVEVGRGAAKVSEIEDCVAHPERRWERKLAPAHGLCLETVEYEE